MIFTIRLIFGAFKEFILSLDRIDGLLVLILILCIGFGRAPAQSSRVGLSVPSPQRITASGLSTAIPHAAPSQTTNVAQ